MVAFYPKGVGRSSREGAGHWALLVTTYFPIWAPETLDELQEMERKEHQH